MCAAVVILSVSSTLVKKSGAPGPTIAFWRTTGAAAVWTAILATSERRLVRPGALPPIVLVPAGAMIFHEHVDARALAFGAISVVGLAMVLFFGPANGEAS